MTDHDLLHDELHELALDYAPDAASARARARHTVARRAHRRRAITTTAMSGGAIVVAVAIVAGTIALTRDHDGSERVHPAVTTASVPLTPTTATTPTTPTFRPDGPISSTIPKNVRIAVELSARHFAWGTGSDQVGFHTPAGEGASGGPVAFIANADGTLVMLDHSNARLVESTAAGTSTVTPIPGLSPAVTAAVFDDQGRVVVATVTDLAVYGPNGLPQGAWSGLATNAITKLVIAADDVYSLDENGLTTPILRGGSSGYTPARGAQPEPAPVSAQRVGESGDRIGFNTPAASPEYVVSAGAFVDVLGVRLLTDGSLVFVLGQPQSATSDPDLAQPYIVGHFLPSGAATYERVLASRGYLTSGPVFDLTDGAVVVMSSTTTAGVTASYHPYP